MFILMLFFMVPVVMAVVGLLAHIGSHAERIVEVHKARQTAAKPRSTRR